MGEFKSDYKWWSVRSFVEAFNERMANVFMPGPTVTVDELMAFWLGHDEAKANRGMPHVTKMKSKPRGVGLMLKAMADGSLNIICALELQEGREVRCYKNNYHNFHSYTVS